MSIDPQREELIREELGRIVASDLFCRSDRLCRFLRFSVEQALRGESDRVKEYVVAVEVFDRPASFDSRVDPVVRVEARRLRDRLKTWAATLASALIFRVAGTLPCSMTRPPPVPRSTNPRLPSAPWPFCRSPT
jgi:hypothetical protein